MKLQKSFANLFNGFTVRICQYIVAKLVLQYILLKEKFCLLGKKNVSQLDTLVIVCMSDKLNRQYLVSDMPCNVLSYTAKIQLSYIGREKKNSNIRFQFLTNLIDLGFTRLNIVPIINYITIKEKCFILELITSNFAYMIKIQLMYDIGREKKNANNIINLILVINRERTFGRGTVRRGTVHRKKELISVRLG